MRVDRKNEGKGEVTTDFALQHTLLCRLMVYSRVTTSAMAERCFLPVCWTLDISVEEKQIVRIKIRRGGIISTQKLGGSVTNSLKGVRLWLAESVDCRENEDFEMAFFRGGRNSKCGLACCGVTLIGCFRSCDPYPTRATSISPVELELD